MSKINILVIPSDKSGVSGFRSIEPHLKLQELYPEEFHVEILPAGTDTFDWSDTNYLKQFQIIHFHRTLFDNINGQIQPVYGERLFQILDNLKKLGIITIMDIDDYWEPTKEHPAYSLIIQSGLPKRIVENLGKVDYVTTTTEIYAKNIRKINKNVMVLPNTIDPNISQFKPNPEPTDKKVRFGWLGGSCMTPDTEILTSEGWKRFDELDQTESVATLNPKTHELEYHKPTGYICEPFEGELNCGKNGLVEYEVTPNHNMFASVAKSLGHKKMNLELIQSEKIHGKNFHVKKDALWVGKEEEYFILPMLNEYAEVSESESYVDRLISKSRKNNLIDKYGSDRFIKMDKWLEFFGFWMAKGWTSKTNGLHQVGIPQIKDNNYLEYMYNLLIEMGFNPKYTKDKTQLRVFDKQLWDYLSNFGYAYDKYVPTEVLNLSPRQLKLFLDWFIKGDGHVEKNKFQRIRAFTCSPTLANNLQEIALKIGVSSTIMNRGKRTSHIRGRKIQNQYDSLVISFYKHPSVSKHNKNTPLIKTEDQYNRFYKGNVYCVEVQNHIIYVRRNGKPFWIGNSHLHDLQILHGVVNRLRQDEDMLKETQMVLCGFDTRGTVTMTNPNTGQNETRKIQPHESVWCRYEEIFTDNYKSLSPEYIKELKKFNKETNYNDKNEPYRRVWTKPITSYATNYNLFDVSIVPLVPHIFNMNKSQLKVVEAAFHKKCLVAQDFGPYQIDMVNNKNGILIKSERNHKDWFETMKKLYKNPNMVSDLGEQLYEDLHIKYHIDTVTKSRRDYYLELVNSNVLV